MPRKGYHAFLLLLLTLFTCSFSFGQTITGTTSDDNNKPLAEGRVAVLNITPTAAGAGPNSIR